MSEKERERERERERGREREGEKKSERERDNLQFKTYGGVCIIDYLSLSSSLYPFLPPSPLQTHKHTQTQENKRLSLTHTPNAFAFQKALPHRHT